MEGPTVSRARQSVCRIFRRDARWKYARPAHDRAVTRGRSSCLLLAALIAVAGASSLGVRGCQNIGPGAPIRNDVCLVCHTGQNAEDITAFRDGPHKGLLCEGCHGSGYLHMRNGGRGGLFISDLNGLRTPADRDLCKRCHETEVNAFETSEHAEEGVLSCVACHNVHAGPSGAPSSENNDMCLLCHASMGFNNDAVVEAHTFHPVDPAGTGASRCTKCHLVPIEREYPVVSILIPPGHGFLRLDHSLRPVPPSRSIEAADNGVVPVPANSCAGVAGCHDGSVVTSPVFKVDDRATNVLLQILYNVRYGPPEAEEDR